MAKKQATPAPKVNPFRQQALQLAEKADKSLGYDAKVIDEVGAGPEAEFSGMQKYYAQKDANFFDPYEDYVDRATLHGGQFSTDELSSIRAQNQSNWAQAGNAVARVAVNIIPQTISGFASMVDIPGYFSAEEAANNSIVNWAMDLKKEVDEDWFPIYEEQPGKSMNLSDPAWWFSRGSGLVESMGSFVLQGYGIGAVVPKVLGGAAKLLKGKDLARAVAGANTSKGILQGANTLTTAAMLNQSESVIGATQVFKDVYQEGLDKGLDFAEAKQRASEAAATTMNLNRINILLNLTSAGSFLKPFKASRQLLTAPSMASSLGKVVSESGQEAVEELVNLVAEESGREVGKGKIKRDNILDDLGIAAGNLGKIKSMEGLEAAVLGAIGGMAQTGGTTALQYSKRGIGSTTDAQGNRISYMEDQANRYKAQQEVINELKDKGVNTTDALKSFKEAIVFNEQLIKAVQDNDQEAYNAVKDQMFENQVYKSASTGTMEVLENLYKAEAAKNPEEVGQEYIDNAKKALSDLKVLEDVYNNSEDYVNSDEVYYNRANKMRAERNLKFLEEGQKVNNLELSQRVRDIAKNYEYETEREIVIKKEGQVERVDKVMDKSPLTYSISNLRENTGKTEAQQKVYNKFLKEVEALDSFKKEEGYQDALDRMSKILLNADKEFATITSKEYQTKAAEKIAKKQEVQAALKELEKTTSIAQVKNLMDTIEDPEFKKAAEKKLQDLERVKNAEQKQRKTDLETQQFADRIKNATEEELATIQEEINEAELSQTRKDDLLEKINTRAKILNGEEVTFEEEQDLNDPLAAFTSVDPVELESQVEQDEKNFSTELPTDLPNPKTEESTVASEVESAAENLLENDRTMVIGTDDQGNLIYNFMRAQEAFNRGAFLSREFNQTENLGTVDREEFTDTVEDNLELLDPDFLTEGTDLIMEVDNDYTGEKYDPTSTTRETYSWPLRLAEIIKKYEGSGMDYRQSPEYIAEVPIKVTTPEGVTVFYIHDNAWHREENLSGTPEEIAEDRRKNFEIRKSIIEKRKVKSKVTYKSFGRLFKTFDGRQVSVDEAMPDPNLILGLGRNGMIELPGNAETVLNGGKLLKSEPQDGRLYAVVKVGPNEYLPIPLQRKPISKEVQDSIVFAIEAHLSNDPENPVVKAIAESSLGFDITTTKGLSDYLSQFIYIYPTEGNQGIESVLMQGGGPKSTLNSKMPLIAVTPTGIQFGRPGVQMGTYADSKGNKVVQYGVNISQNFEKTDQGSRRNAATIVDKLLPLLQSGNILTNANRDSIARGRDAVLILNPQGDTRTDSYNNFLKSGYESNILSINIGTEEDPKWVYTIQPTITFDTSFANVSPVQKATTARPVKKPRQQPTPTPVPVSEDIEAKVAERVKRYSNRPANRMQKFNPEGDNTDLTQEQIDEIEKYIEAAKKAGWNVDRTFRQLSRLGYTYALGNTTEAFKNYLEDRLSGETNIKVTSEFNINEQIREELAALEGQLIAKPQEPLYYKGANPAVDVIVTAVEGGEQKVLLVKRKEGTTEEGKWALPGGFVETDAKKGNKWKAGKETDAQAATREIKEETGLELTEGNLALSEKLTDKTRDPRSTETSWVETSVYSTTVPADQMASVKGRDDASEAKWFTVSELVEMPNSDFAFDHAELLAKNNLKPAISPEEEVENKAGVADLQDPLSIAAENIIADISIQEIRTIINVLEEGGMFADLIQEAGFASVEDALAAYRRANDLYTERAKDTDSIVLPNGNIFTIDGNDLDIGDNSDDTFDDFMIQPVKLTEDQVAAQKAEIDEMIIKGLNPASQQSLIAYLSADIINQAIAAKEVDGKQTVQVKPILDKHYETFKAISEMFKKRGLTNRAKHVDAILDQYDKVRRLVNQNMSKFTTGVVEDIELDENEESVGLERGYSENWAFTVSSKTTASGDLKKFFSSITARDENGVIKNPLGFTEVIPFDIVYDTLHEILANKPADYVTMIEILELNTEKFPWLQSVIDKIEAAPEKIQNEFVSDMTKHHIDMQFIMWSKDPNGNYSLQTWSANATSTENRLRAIWASNLKGLSTQSNLVFVDENDTYQFNSDVAEVLNQQFEEFKNNPDAVTNEDLATWLGNFGIVLSDETYNDLRKGRYNNKGRKTWDQLFKNSQGLVRVLNTQLQKQIKLQESQKESQKENSSLDIESPIQKLMSDSAIKALAKLDAMNSLNTFSNSFQAGGKTIYSYGNNNFLVNRMRDLTAYDSENGKFINQQLIDDLKAVSFTGASTWLEELTSDSEVGDLTRRNMRVGYLSLEALKKLFTPSQDNRKLNNLTAAEHEVAKIGFFQNVSGEVIDKEQRRIVDFFYPTMSDKTTMLTLRALAREFKFETGTSTISAENIKMLYNAVVLPEINRMRSKKSNNIKGYEPNYFYFFPTLNSLPVEVNGVVRPFRDIVLDESDLVYDKEVQDAVNQELENIFTKLLDKKLEDWNNLGIGQNIKDAKGKVTDNYTFLDKSYMESVAKGTKGEGRVKYAAADYVFNYLIANAEAYKLFAGDPALYAKFNSKNTLEQNLESTFINIGKRLAGDIAPGMELANSMNNKYYQVYLADKEIASNNVKDSVQREFFEKISSSYAKDYGKIEGSDAQEYTTWQEHLYVMKQLGRLTKAQYETFKRKLEAQSEGNFNKTNLLTYQELGIILQPIKPVYVGNILSREDNADRRVYIKSSSFPLIPELTTGLQMDKIRQALEKFESDNNTKVGPDGSPLFVRASFGTANKVGSVKNTLEVFDDNGNVKDNLEVTEANTLVLNRSNFRIQQDVPYKREKDSVNVGTQESKLLFVNLMDTEVSKGRTGEKLFEEYNQTYQDLFKYNQEKLAKSLGLVETKLETPNLASVATTPTTSTVSEVTEAQESLKDLTPIKKATKQGELVEQFGKETIDRVNFINRNFDKIVEAIANSNIEIFADENNEFKKCD
jgi:8-oxo-dGTP diphosphatase